MTTISSKAKVSSFKTIVILDLFNQKLYKENGNNINIIKKLENGKYIIDKATHSISSGYRINIEAHKVTE